MMVDELAALADDLTAEKQRLRESLERLEGTLSRDAGGGTRPVQAEIESLNQGLQHLELLAAALAQSAIRENLIPANGFLQALASAAGRKAQELGRDVHIVCKPTEALIDSGVPARFEQVLAKMVESLVEFSIEGEKERTLRGKRVRPQVRLELDEIDDGHRIMAFCDGNGIMPPLAEQHATELGHAGGRTTFEGVPGKWSAWRFYLTEQVGPQRLLTVKVGEELLCIPAWAVLGTRSGRFGTDTVAWRLDETFTRKEADGAATGTVYVEVAAGMSAIELVCDAVVGEQKLGVKLLSPRLNADGRFSGLVVADNALRLVLNPAYLVFGRVK